jgi:GMP reductase
MVTYDSIKTFPRKSILKSRSEADISRALGKHTFSAPVCAANMQSILTPQVCQIFDSAGWFYVQERISGPEFVRNFALYAQDLFKVVSLSVGITAEWLELLQIFKKENYRIDYLTIDIAHSYTDAILPIVNYIKVNFPDTYLIVGNGMLPEWIEWLESLGVNCAKVGLGNGSSCSTYNSTSFKSDVLDLKSCIEVAKTIDIMADGGFGIDQRTNIICVGDMVKSLVLGSNFIMSGAAFKNCTDVKSSYTGYYGNASLTAKKSNTHVEGVLLDSVTNNMSVLETISYIEDCLKSAVSYAGGVNLSCFNSLNYRLT